MTNDISISNQKEVEKWEKAVAAAVRVEAVVVVPRAVVAAPKVAEERLAVARVVVGASKAAPQDMAGQALRGR